MKKSWYIIKSNGHIKCADKKQAREIFAEESGQYAIYTSSDCPSSSSAKKYYF